MLWRYGLLAVVLLAVGIFWFFVVVIGMAQFLLRPLRMSAGRALVILNRLTPADLNLPYEEVRFTVHDRAGGGDLQLISWWIESKQPSSRCVILLHGYGDAKIGSIAWAPLFRSMGFNVLALDLRAHGESGGTYCTAGFYERDDLDQIIEQLRTARADHVCQLVLFGVSLGAAVATATAARRSDIDAVILECPFADYQQAVSNHVNIAGLPGARFQAVAYRLAQYWGKCDFAAVRPVALLAAIRCPILLVQAGDDPIVNATEQETLRAALRSRGNLADVIWDLPDVAHVLGFADDPVGYRKRIEDFLSRALPTPAVVCES